MCDITIRAIEDRNVNLVVWTLSPALILLEYHWSNCLQQYQSTNPWAGFPVLRFILTFRECELPGPTETQSYGVVCVYVCVYVCLRDTSIGTHTYQIRSDHISCSVVSNSLGPYESHHARPPYPSSTPGVHSDSRPSSQ